MIEMMSYRKTNSARTVTERILSFATKCFLSAVSKTTASVITSQQLLTHSTADWGGKPGWSVNSGGSCGSIQM